MAGLQRQAVAGQFIDQPSKGDARIAQNIRAIPRFRDGAVKPGLGRMRRQIKCAP